MHGGYLLACDTRHATERQHASRNTLSLPIELSYTHAEPALFIVPGPFSSSLQPSQCYLPVHPSAHRVPSFPLFHRLRRLRLPPQSYRRFLEKRHLARRFRLCQLHSSLLTRLSRIAGQRAWQPSLNRRLNLAVRSDEVCSKRAALPKASRPRTEVTNLRLLRSIRFMTI